MAIGDTVGPNYDNIARVKRMEENKKPEKNKKNKKNKSPAQPKANPVGTNLPESSRVQESMGKPTVVEEVPTKKVMYHLQCTQLVRQYEALVTL
ncbi:hypothetical protein EhV18_00446 [Emiliania huxleyi virus 18]|nr:hypothetical protein EhV18_00446 [Emiliania huxleyi virus 18]